ncbi:MAG: class I SAM-dependent methyltransferase [Oscillospiraceae bacterium]|nr:class I SAM-dependent methyltransferase [Oscillospiraceae bacterium]
MNTLKLSNRLQTIAKFVPQGACIADIGTDHGYLPVYLAQKGRTKRLIASDISEGSLSAARRSAAKYGLVDRLELICASGLDGISAGDVDTIVIAGMGGETIISILRDAPWTKIGKTLILQPQSKLDLLAAYLHDNGYAVTGVELALDEGKYYMVLEINGVGGLKGAEGSEKLEVHMTAKMTAKAQEVCVSENASEVRATSKAREASEALQGEAVQHISSPQLSLLKMLAADKDPHIVGYLNKQIASAKRAAEGMKVSNNPGYRQAEKYLQELVALSLQLRHI